MKPKQKAHQRYRVHFVLVQCSSTWGLLVSVVAIPSVTALEKKNYWLVSLSHQVSVVTNFLFRDRTLCPLHLLLHFGIFFFWFDFTQSLCMLSVSLCSYVSVYMYQKMLFPWESCTSQHLTHKHVEEVVEWVLWARFWWMTPRFLRLWRKGLIKTSY